MRRVLAAGAAVLLLASATVWGWSRSDPSFPHEQHAKLFPLCESCHADVTSNELADLYPQAGSCANCHDGKRLDRVEWAGPKRPASNLAFSHGKHRENEPEATCNSCHGVQGSTAWMAVARAAPDNCLACHSRTAGPRQHLAMEARCRTCHVPVAAATDLTGAQISAFPKPSSPCAPDFISRHAPDVRLATQNCSVCHAAESCARCHANAQKLPAVVALQSDGRFADLLLEKRAVYPIPASHAASYFIQEHGAAANKNIASCANCHTRPSCVICHAAGGAADQIAQLPEPRAGLATGVVFAGIKRIHPIDFSTAHAISAQGDGASCSGCHREKFCTDCHRGSESRRFHPLNYAARHGPDAYGSTAIVPPVITGRHSVSRAIRGSGSHRSVTAAAAPSTTASRSGFCSTVRRRGRISKAARHATRSRVVCAATARKAAGT
jgi:predicted CXXCH cytochrome family protein